jgi:hypothetical protein
LKIRSKRKPRAHQVEFPANGHALLDVVLPGRRNLSSAIANPLHFRLRFAHVESAPFQTPVGRVHLIGCWPRDAPFVVFDLFDVSLGLGHVKFPNIGTALQPLDCFHLFVCALDALAAKQLASCARFRVVETALGGVGSVPVPEFAFHSSLRYPDTTRAFLCPICPL